MSLSGQRSHVPVLNHRKTPNPGVRKGINRVSGKMRRLNGAYAKLRDAFLVDHPYCQHWLAENGIPEEVAINNAGLVYMKIDGVWDYHAIPKATEVHHKKGRGKYHLDTSTWMAVRFGHSIFIHGDPKTSYDKGYMLPRND